MNRYGLMGAHDAYMRHWLVRVKAVEGGGHRNSVVHDTEDDGLSVCFNCRPEGCPGGIYDVMVECHKHKSDERPTFAEILTRLQMDREWETESQIY